MRARSLLLTIALSTTAAAFIACGIEAVGQMEAPPPPPARDAEPFVPPPKLDASPSDASPDVGPPCPSDAGSTMVPIGDGGACIDRTEVTNRQYLAFLAATDGGSASAFDAGLPPACTARVSFARAVASDPPDHPIIKANWCDGHAYCAWAGKRLCGYSTDWLPACTRNGTRTYPWGSTPDGGVCNIGTTSAVDAGSLASCMGGIDDVFDMVGNVGEFTTACDGGLCTAAGGGYLDPSGTCSSVAFVYPNVAEKGYGFRCCR